MFKSLSWRASTNPKAEAHGFIRFLLLCALLYMALFTPTLILQRWSYQGDLSVAAVAAILVTSTVLSASIFAALALSRVLFTVMVPMLFVTSALAFYFAFTVNIVITTGMVAALFETSVEEALGVTGKELVGWLVVNLLIGILVVRRFRAVSYPGKFKIAQMLFVLTALVPLLRVYENPIYYFPMNFVGKTYSYLSNRVGSGPIPIKKNKDRYDFSRDVLTFKSAEDITVVLVIGESARADHFGINGYSRDTTPELAKVAGLLSFRNTVSCGVETREALPCMLTRATLADRAPAANEKSVTSVFNRLGFHTAWISNQDTDSGTRGPLPALAKEASTVVLKERKDILDLRNYDEDLLPQLDRVLRANISHKFIVVHPMGSHWPYTNRYTKAYERYTPVCTGRTSKWCGHQSIINAYDNSILYTDAFLSQIIRRLAGENALFVYISDHGESLGENGRYLHGHEGERVETHVPFIVWASEKFLANPQWQKKYDHARAHLAAPLSHDYLFHSLLDCIGVESTIVDRHLSLCQP